MKTTWAIAVSALLGAAAGPHRAAAQGGPPPPSVVPPTPPPAGLPPPPGSGGQPPAPGARAVPSPIGTPGAPSEEPPPPPGPAVPDGQWVYTQQYGWIWEPHAQAYTYIPPGSEGEPLVFVFYPAYGWRWVVAPWVWGVGPWPAFGTSGPSRFAWYRAGSWRTPSRWHFHPAPPGRDLDARGNEEHAHGIRPAPQRGEVRAGRRTKGGQREHGHGPR